MSLRGQPLKVNYAYRQFADEIEAQIMQGTLKPGERLPGEQALAEMFSVTRSTVREGLRQLESEGLIHRPSPRRLEVAIPQSNMLATRSSRAMVLMNITFYELWVVALETEQMAAGYAAERATPEGIAKLEDVHARLVAARNNVVDTTKLDTEFHTEVAIAGGNRALTLAREPIALLLFQAFAQVAPKISQAMDRQIEAHSHIVDAIRDRDVERARIWARRHIEDFGRGIKMAGLEKDRPIFSSKSED